MADEPGVRDARQVTRRTDRSYPGNARRSRRWVWAIALPVAVFAALAGVFIYQRVFGGPSADPLTINSHARDTVILLPPPDGWTRTDVVTTCPGRSGCGGGAFLQVGTTSTRWVTPRPAGGTSYAAAAATACDQLATQLQARSSAPEVRPATCAALLGRTSARRQDGATVLGWKDTTGTWTLRTAARSDRPTDDPRRFGFEIAYLPNS